MAKTAQLIVGILILALMILITPCLYGLNVVCEDEVCRVDLKGKETAFRGEIDSKATAKDFSLPDLNNRKVQLADFKDSILIIGRGMSWCAGCPPEGHGLSKLWPHFKNQGVQFLYFDMGEPPNTAVDFAKYCRFAFPVLLCTSYELPGSYQAGNPGVIIIDRQKKVRMKGYFYELGYGQELIGDMLSKILEEQPAKDSEKKISIGMESTSKTQVLEDSWIPAMRLSIEGVKSYQPSVTASSKRGIWVAWAENIMKNGEIALRHFNGQKWLAIEHPVSSQFDDYAPRIITDRTGKLWLAWVSNRSGKYAIWSSCFNDKKWQKPVIISSNMGDCYHPSITVDNGGRVCATWYAWSLKTVGDREYHWRSIKVSYWNGSNWSPPEEVTPYYDICVDHWDPEVIIDKTGRPLICWAKDNRNDPTIFSKSYRGESWTKDIPVSKPPKPEWQRAVPGRAFDFAPSLTISRDGSLWAFWQANAQRSWGGWQIKCAQWINGQWPKSEQISHGFEENCTPVAISDSNDNLLVFWTNLKKPDGHWNICFSRRKQGKWVKPRVLISGGNNLNPATCIDKSGKVWLIWQGGGEGKWNIYATAEK